MTKIAMLNCLKANEVCAGASCMRALNERKSTFAAYQDEDVELVAFMRCNGCGKSDPGEGGMLEKIERLQSIGTDVVHVGVCTVRRSTGTECEEICRTIDALEARGIRIVRGTH